MTAAVRQYLERYAEPSTRVRCPLAAEAAAIAIVVPVYDESLDVLDEVERLTGFEGALVVVVVNHSENAPERAKRRNHRLLDAARTRARAEWNECGEGITIATAGQGWLCLIDRCTPAHELPKRRSGVGVARKIGADLMLRWSSALRSRWIVSTDADATIPHPLLDRVRATASECSALSLPFVHVHDGDDAVFEATRLYERHLRGYQRGLEQAGSPYAFETLGSALAFDRADYARVRGFPPRRGGEDFYLLNKLAKVRGVRRKAGPPVRIRARRSSRAPFGTGPAVARILDGPDLVCPTYDPRQYEVLKVLLDAVERSVRHRIALDAAIAALCEERGVSRALQEATVAHAQAVGLQARLSAAVAQTQTPERALRRFHEYFDGLRTLQWFHGMRAHLPDVLIRPDADRRG